MIEKIRCLGRVVEKRVVPDWGTKHPTFDMGSFAHDFFIGDQTFLLRVLRVISAGTSNVDDAVDKRKSIYSLDKDGFIGFNPIVKRTCAAVTAKETQRPDLFPSPSHPAYP